MQLKRTHHTRYGRIKCTDNRAQHSNWWHIKKRQREGEKHEERKYLSSLNVRIWNNKGMT